MKRGRKRALFLFLLEVKKGIDLSVDYKDSGFAFIFGSQPMNLAHGLEGSLDRMKADRESDFDKDEHRVPFGFEAFHEDEFDERWGELNSFLGGTVDRGIGPQVLKGHIIGQVLGHRKSLRSLQRNRRPYLFGMPFGFRE